MTSRRLFLRAGLVLAVAPAIVRASSLMPIKPLYPEILVGQEHDFETGCLMVKAFMRDRKRGVAYAMGYLVTPIALADNDHDVAKIRRSWDPKLMKAIKQAYDIRDLKMVA